MSADDRNVVPQRQKLSLIELQQLPVIASGKIAAADRTGEQHIADDRQTLHRIEKDDASRRMSGTMQDVECQLADVDLISVLQPSVGSHV